MNRLSGSGHTTYELKSCIKIFQVFHFQNFIFTSTTGILCHFYIYIYIVSKKVLIRLIFHVVCVNRLKENMLNSSELHLTLFNESKSLKL